MLPKKSKPKALLLGLGLDNKDEHVRVTRGEEFCLLGGSRETHEEMQEKAVRFSEKLSRQGKKLGDISAQEFLDLAQEVGLHKSRRGRE